MSAKLIVAHSMVRKASENLHRVLRAEYPVGAKVRWVYQQQPRSGTVIAHSFGDRIRVRNDYTGQTLWISATDVLLAFATEVGATA